MNAIVEMLHLRDYSLLIGLLDNNPACVCPLLVVTGRFHIFDTRIHQHGHIGLMTFRQLLLYHAAILETPSGFLNQCPQEELACNRQCFAVDPLEFIIYLAGLGLTYPIKLPKLSFHELLPCLQRRSAWCWTRGCLFISPVLLFAGIPFGRLLVIPATKTLGPDSISTITGFLRRPIRTRAFAP